MTVNVTTWSLEDIERRRQEIRAVVESDDFKERRAEDALLEREERLLEELDDLDYLQHGRLGSH